MRPTALSGASVMDTGWAAVKLGLTGYIIPFMFVFAPSLLLIGEPDVVALAVVTRDVGVVCLAGGLHQYFFFGPARCVGARDADRGRAGADQARLDDRPGRPRR